MKIILFAFFIFKFSDHCLSQKFIVTYYQYNWSETPTRSDASYYSQALNTDSGWYRLDYYISTSKNKLEMAGLYADKETKIKNGTFRWYYPSGNAQAIGTYKMNKKEGIWYEFYSNGALKDSSTFHNGEYIGISLSWYRDGAPKDSMNLDANGNGVLISWFNNGNPSEAGRFINHKKAGKWAYYHNNGNISSIEVYKEDSLISYQYYDEKAIAINVPYKDYKEAEFKGGDKGWKNFVANSLKFPSNFDIVNSDQILVIVEATINEDGKIIDPEVTLPYYLVFDKEALRFISSSPNWNPAISHNRRVSQTLTFPLRFSQSFGN